MSIFDPEKSQPTLAVDEIQAARALNVSPSTFRELVRAGEIPRIKIRRCTRFAIADLVRYLDTNRQVKEADSLLDAEVDS